MEFWIARDELDSLRLFINKPEKIDGCYWEVLPEKGVELDSKLFSEVTSKNSPQKVKIIIEKENN